MSRKLIYTLLGCLVFALPLLYFFYQRQVTAGPQALVYNPVSSQWEEIQVPPRVELTELEPHPNETGLNNRAVLRGYFADYNPEQDQLRIKVELPFTGGQQFSEYSFQLPLDKKVYCSPSTITDQVSGAVYQTKDLGFIVKNDQVMQISREQVLPFAQFVEQANQSTYLFLQLSSNFNPKVLNYISKLVVIGLCD